MASVEKRTRNGRVRWYARYRTPAGEQRTKTFDTKRDAERYLTQMEGAKLVGGFVDPRRARVTVGEWCDQWLDTKTNISPKTRERYEGIISTHIKPQWHAVPLGDVTHADVQAWVSGLDLAPASVRKVHRVFALAMALAVKDDRLAKNPAKGVTLPRVDPIEKRYLSHAAVDALATAVPPFWRLLVLFLAYTGLRWGEVAALRVSRLDLLRRRVIVAESVTPVRGKLVWGPTKGHRRREVPIPKFLVKDLEALIEGKGKDSLLFTGPRGGVLRASTFKRAALIPAAEALGLCKPKLDALGRQLTKKIKGQDGQLIDKPVFTAHFHPHEFRHTAASLAIAAGADVKVVQQMLGHKSATLTLDLYGHLFGDRLDVVADAMDTARTAALAGA